MTLVQDFYSVNEAIKPATKRRYHNNSACAAGRDIPSWERKPGTNGYPLCEDCIKATSNGK